MNQKLLAIVSIALAASLPINKAVAVGHTYSLAKLPIGSYGPGIGMIGNGHFFALSANGRYVAYTALETAAFPNVYPIYVHDRLNGTHKPLPPTPNGVAISGFPSSISADGRFVAFSSDEDNLVSGDTNNETDAFVTDRLTGKTRRVSVASDGTQISGFGQIIDVDGGLRSGSTAGDISADGRLVSFVTFSRDLLPKKTPHLARQSFLPYYRDYLTYTHDMANGKTSWAGWGGKSRMSADARYLLLTTDSGPSYTYVHDRLTGQNTTVSVASNNQPLVCNTPPGDEYYGCAGSVGLDLSDDGRFILFTSDLNNQEPGCDGNDGVYGHHIYLHDRSNGHTHCITAGFGHAAPYTGSLSANGRYAVFDAWRRGGPANHGRDIYLYDRISDQYEQVSVGNNGKDTQQPGFTVGQVNSDISADGRKVLFSSGGQQSEDYSWNMNLYLRDRLLQPKHNPVDATVHFDGSTAVVGTGQEVKITLSFRLQPSLPGVEYQLTPSQGRCETGPIKICRLGIIPESGQATVSFKLTKAPPHLKAFTAYADVSTPFKDANPWNNSATAKIPR